MIEDIRKPYKKQRLDTLLSLVADMEFAYSDEFYSKDENCLAIDYDWKVDFALNTVAKLKMVDKPRWFESELEAVVLLESTMRVMLPPLQTDSWPEMSSDKAMSTVAFSGIGQLYLLSREAWEKQRACQWTHANGHMPTDPSARKEWYADMKGSGVVECELPEDVTAPVEAAYMLDLTTMSKYAVREGFACYGGCAFFGADKKLLAIYNCQSKKLLSAPDFPSVEWENAKFTIRCSVISMVTLREHLMYCHWTVSNRCGISSREELGKDHPVRRILALFTFRSGAINFMSTITLMQENMLLHRASPFEQHGCLVSTNHNLHPVQVIRNMAKRSDWLMCSHVHRRLSKTAPPRGASRHSLRLRRPSRSLRVSRYRTLRMASDAGMFSTGSSLITLSFTTARMKWAKRLCRRTLSSVRTGSPWTA